MSQYTDIDEVAAHALQLCEDVRAQYPPFVFEGLVRECARFPARMAQLLMCLAVWVDYEGPTSALIARAAAVAAARAHDEDDFTELVGEA